MFPNLRGEMAKFRVTGNDLAAVLNIRPATFSEKMNGKSDFTFTEATLIKSYLGTSLSLEELFERGN